MYGLVEPKEAAKALGISTATITRCKNNGAPVHPWGSTGRRYRICIPEFVEWMERQGKEEKPLPKAKKQSVQAMATERRMRVMTLGA